jgi:hypothetical protein
VSDKPEPRWTTRGGRDTAIGHLMASVGHLKASDRRAFAQELIVQALDVLPDSQWQDVFNDACEELMSESRDAADA